MVRYKLLLPLLSLYFIGFTLYESIRSANLRYLWQRFGFRHPRHESRPLWLHAASVGEVNTLLPLINTLKTRHPDTPLLLTTATPTGAQMVKKHLGGDVQHHFLPLDWSFAVSRFLRNIQPRCAIIMETELWPNLYRGCRSRSIPLVIINARLSHRTLDRAEWIRQIYTSTLKHTRAILARSETDRKAFELLGAPAGNVESIGNLKFASDNTAIDAEQLISRPYVLAASTHDDEELQLTQAWMEQAPVEKLLVIAPRHPVRRDAILKQLSALTATIAVRSRGDVITEQTRVYLADTLGELTALMQHAEVVFMGGSLIAHGGQNLLEPARLGRPILFGPHMHNFALEAAALTACDGAIQVGSASEAMSQITALLSDNTRCEAMGRNAQDFIQQEADVAQRYADRLDQLCPEIAES